MNITHLKFRKLLFISATSLSVYSCSVSDSFDGDYSKWDFSGSVVDATDNQHLSEVTIVYQDASGKKIETQTDSNGFFFIDELPYGSHTFTFSYKKINGKDTLFYTPKTISISSTNESSHMEGVVANNSSIVRLNPINASLTGEFYIYDEDSGKNIPVLGAELNIIHQDTNFINLFPANFSTETDSTGSFSFHNLPADTGFILQIKPYSYNGARYTTTSIELPRLLPNTEKDIGRNTLVRDSSIEKSSAIISSNVLDANMNGFANVSTLTIPYYVFREKLSEKNLSVSVKADTSIFYVTPTLKNDTLFLKHDIAFPAESKISVNITAYKKKNNDRIALELSGDSAFTTDRGLYAITSNAWPSNKNFKATFGIEDTIWVKFSEKLDENTDRIQWNYASDMARTIYANGYYANANSWIKKDTLFVQMQEKILDSREQGDSVGMNITVYAKNEMYLKNFILKTELEVPPSSSSSEASSSSSAAQTSSSSEETETSSSATVSSSSSTKSSSSASK